MHGTINQKTEEFQAYFSAFPWNASCFSNKTVGEASDDMEVIIQSAMEAYTPPPPLTRYLNPLTADDGPIISKNKVTVNFTLNSLENIEISHKLRDIKGTCAISIFLVLNFNFDSFMQNCNPFKRKKLHTNQY